MPEREPSKEPSKRGRPPKRTEELPDDKAIQRLFPAKIVRAVNKAIGHNPRKSGPEK